jgi:hypothetical protein
MNTNILKLVYIYEYNEHLHILAKYVAIFRDVQYKG